MGESMKFSLRELNQLPAHGCHVDEDVAVTALSVPDQGGRMIALNSVHFTGDVHYEPTEEMVVASGVVSGEMTVPCAITLEPIPYRFETPLEAVYSARTGDPDDLPLEDPIDLDPVIAEAVMLEIPLRAVKAGLEAYPSGEGWAVISEAEADKTKQDPRLAKLKDYIPED